MDTFLLHLQDARDKMSSGQYQEAFKLIVDLDVQSLPSLMKKIECMIDIGFILRDEKILRYGIYLLEKHGSEVLEVEDLAPVYFLNLANQYVNMITLSSYNDEFFGYYSRGELLRARESYEKALSYDNLTSETSYQIHLGLARILFIGGRGVEALEHYQAALKFKPEDPECLMEKIQLMSEYARINSLNSKEILREAWHLNLALEQRESAENEYIQAGMELRGRILEQLADRSFLDAEEDYPLHSIVTDSEEEHQYTLYSLRHNLYLNLCGFCRKCDFAAGDQVRLNSGSLIIRQNQKKRFASLASSYSRLCELYRTGRFLLIDSIQSGRNRSYADPGNPKPGLTDYAAGSMEYYLLRNAFLHGWDIWDAVRDYLVTYWDLKGKEGDPVSLFSMFHERGQVRAEWKLKHSPSLHAVYDLYMDCLRGSRNNLLKTAEDLKTPLREGNYLKISEKTLQSAGTELYRVLRWVILYLGIMHERNELQDGSWQFPRPLYNFFMSEKEL